MSIIPTPLLSNLLPPNKLQPSAVSATPAAPVLPPLVLPVPPVIGQGFQASPLEQFNTPKFARPLTLIEALLGVNASVTTIRDNLEQVKKLLPELQFSSPPLTLAERDVIEEPEYVEKRQSICSNPKNRTEWDRLSNRDKRAFVDGIKCLLNRLLSGQFRQAQNRYEDLVVLHQTLTPSFHGNAKFLLFHRYYLWAFEDVLRRECGYSRDMPWFDESRKAITDARNSRTSYVDMASCAEGAAHAWGHNGIGAVMQDTYAAPADPVFWLHHAYIDRNSRVWQDGNSAVCTITVRGTDANGRQLTLDTIISVGGVRPDVQIRDILNTQSPLLCYRYTY
ncbi:hypothetical protein GQ44DRAFT_781035 [Phaeosphaeriaceae sp. PMI808]|nr:hypothetical protein GQ44DRAFT_781035 [Phaeosphaeriaceae sp. PMI808]